MLIEVFLAIVQAATEFLPISSSGHLALFSNLFSEVDLFFFVILHLASLLAVVVFTRHEIYKLATFKKSYRKMWLYLLVGIIPAGLAGLFLKDYFEGLASNYLFLAGSFFFTGLILIGTKNFKSKKKIGYSSALAMGLMQVLALFPGISRSGMTISAGLFSGVSKKEAFRFSFLMLIPLTLGAVVLSWSTAFFNLALLISFIVCFITSLAFLKLLEFILMEDYFWVFGIYCFVMSLVSLTIGLMG
jgi:undecaprenyl-diphosphatase